MTAIFKSIRQQLWAISLFVTGGIVVLLWTSESTAGHLYRMAQLNSISYSSNGSEVKDATAMNQSSGNLRFVDNSVNRGGNQVEDPNSTTTTVLFNTSTPLPAINLQASDFSKSSSVSSSLFATTSPKSSGGDSRTTTLSDHKFRWCHDNETEDDAIASELDCALLFDGPPVDGDGRDNETFVKTKERAKLWTSPCQYTDERIAELAETNCTNFLRTFNFHPDDHVDEVEAAFPLAYVMVAEKWAWQVLRILSAVYRPHNSYCLTYDQHASSEYKRAINASLRCLSTNFHEPREHIEIYWADISLLKATLNCMKVLDESPTDWKYVQILSYNDFPLRTNREMVRILDEFRGANDVELNGGQAERYAHYHRMSVMDEERKNESRPIPPDDMIIFKGSFAATLSRNFIRFVFRDARPQRLLNWSEPTWAPEEQFWSTLVHNSHLHAPGSYPGSCLDYYRHGNVEKLWISRFQVWYTGCEGTWTSGSCVFGVGDLSMLSRRPEFVAHKFYQDFEPAGFYCLARRHYERTYLANRRNDTEFRAIPLDTDYYASLPAIQYQRTEDKSKFSCAVTFEQRP